MFWSPMLVAGMTFVGLNATAQTAPAHSSQGDAQAASERGYHALLMVPIEAPVITEQQYFDQGRGSCREEAS